MRDNVYDSFSAFLFCVFKPFSAFGFALEAVYSARAPAQDGRRCGRSEQRDGWTALMHASSNAKWPREQFALDVLAPAQGGGSIF